MSHERDLKYAAKFWEKDQSEGLILAMARNIRSASLEGKIHTYVNPKGYDENDKMKMCAYRLLADAIGFEIGTYQLDRKAGTATAPINKRNYY